jgi:hypothetical protein
MSEYSRGETTMGTTGSELHLQMAIYKRLADGQHVNEKNPLSLSAILNSVDRYMAELGLDERAIESAKSEFFRNQMRGAEFFSPDGPLLKLLPAEVLVGKSKGEDGLYIAPQ